MNFLIKPTRNCSRDVYGFIVAASRWNDRCSERWLEQPRAHTAGHILLLNPSVSRRDAEQQWIMPRCKQSSARPPNCNFLCLILVTRVKEIPTFRRMHGDCSFPRRILFPKSTLACYAQHLGISLAPLLKRDCNERIWNENGESENDDASSLWISTSLLR